LGGENSSTSAVTVGRSAPRPRPAKKRVISKARKFGVMAEAIIIAENPARLMRTTFRRPIRSAMVPANSAPSSMPTSVKAAARPTMAGLSAHAPSFSNAGATAP
jgi:hypothetical protein